jgi:hypothetical protein
MYEKVVESESTVKASFIVIKKHLESLQSRFALLLNAHESGFSRFRNQMAFIPLQWIHCATLYTEADP